MRLTVVRRQKTRKLIESRIKAVLDAQGEPIVGMAFVVWGPDGASTADVVASLPGNSIPSCLVPEFVKLRLLGEVVEGWAIKALEQ